MQGAGGLMFDLDARVRFELCFCMLMLVSFWQTVTPCYKLDSASCQACSGRRLFIICGGQDQWLYAMPWPLNPTKSELRFVRWFFSHDLHQRLSKLAVLHRFWSELVREASFLDCCLKALVQEGWVSAMALATRLGQSLLRPLKGVVPLSNLICE